MISRDIRIFSFREVSIRRLVHAVSYDEEKAEGGHSKNLLRRGAGVQGRLFLSLRQTSEFFRSVFSALIVHASSFPLGGVTSLSAFYADCRYLLSVLQARSPSHVGCYLRVCPQTTEEVSTCQPCSNSREPPLLLMGNNRLVPVAARATAMRRCPG